MHLRLSRMESLAATGLAHRFQTEMGQVMARRNADLLAILEEHGYHRVPRTFRLICDADEYVTAIEWDTETEPAPENPDHPEEHFHG